VNPQIDLTHVRTLRLATGLHEQRKKIMQATSLQLSRGVEHLGLFVVHNFDLDLSCEYLPTSNASTIDQNFGSESRSLHYQSPLHPLLLPLDSRAAWHLCQDVSAR
jgi:hypothetical protein